MTKQLDGADPKNTVNSVLKACRVMEAFSLSNPELTLAEIATAAELTRPTAHRLLGTLQAAGWVIRTPANRYALSLKVFTVGTAARDVGGLRTLARPILEDLARVTGDAAYLFVPHDGMGMCADRVEGPHPVRVQNVGVGDHISLWSGAAPAALLAHRPDLYEEVVVPHAFTRAQRRHVDERLARARESGVLVSPDDLMVGVTAVGAPVFDGSGMAVASLSVTGLSDRMARRLEDTRQHVAEAARRLSSQLGYAGRQAPTSGGQKA